MEQMREILANCLCEHQDGYTVNALISKFPTLEELLNTDIEELNLIEEVGPVKARQLTAILAFARSVRSPVLDKRTIIRSPVDVFELVRGDMEFMQVEHFDVIGLSTKNHVVFRENISVGSLNASIVHPRETFKPLIKRACASCVLAHNHPSGDPMPSQEDIELTKKLVGAGKLLDINVLDHIIVGFGTYVSLKEKGLI